MKRPGQGLEAGLHHVVGLPPGKEPQVQGEPPVVHQTPQELPQVVVVHPARLPHHGPGLGAVLQVGPSREVQDAKDQGLVHGGEGLGVALQAPPLPQSLL